MAFTTIAGSGATDPTLYNGTADVDAIALVNSEGNFNLQAGGSADVVNLTDSGSALYGAVVDAISVKGGTGADTFTTGGNARGMVLTNGFINLNADDDTLTLRAADTGSALTIKGGQGDDAITAGAFSASFLNANKDDDTVTLAGVSTGSTVRGGQGTDSVNVNANYTGSLIAGDIDADTITDAAGAVTLLTTTVQGNGGNDTLNMANTAAGSTLTLRGGADNDTITTGAAADTLFGDNGNDSLTAAAGNDTITTGTGIDTVAQGASTALTASTFAAALVAAGDTVTFANGLDIVTDFVAGTDRISGGAAAAAATTGIGRNNTNAFITGTVTYSLSGTFVAATGVFTIAADNGGSDTLIVNGGGAANSLGNAPNATLLQGVSQNLSFVIV